MVKLEEARKMVLALPDVTEGTSWGNRTFAVNSKAFAWERLHVVNDKLVVR